MKKEFKTKYEKLAYVQAQAGAVGKNGTAKVGRGSYDYSKIEDINSALSIPLKEVEACVVDEIITSGSEEGLKSHYMLTSFICNDGDISTKTPMVGWETSLIGNNLVQSMGSAITYARKYNRNMLFNLSPSDDDDGAACGQQEKKKGCAKSANAVINNSEFI